MLSHKEKHATNKKGYKQESGGTGRQEETKFLYCNYEAKEQINFEVSKCIWFPSKREVFLGERKHQSMS